MSLSDRLVPLPPIVKRVETANVVVEPSIAAKAVVEPVEMKQAEKRFVIVCSRDLSEKDEALFKQQGRTLRWKECLLNMPFESLEFDYLFIDLRSKNARITLSRQDLSKFNVVAYVFVVQKGTDDFIDELGAVNISSIPSEAVNKKDFDNMLINPKITSPSLIKSFLRSALSCLGK